MPHTQTKIYSAVISGVKYGIDPADVAYVLGETTGDYGTLCTSDNIKKWAKYKPLPVGNVGGYSEAQAKKSNFGLLVPYYTNIGSMITDIGLNTWTRAVNYNPNIPFFTYTKPSTYRIGDFDGYNHASIAPFSEVVPDALSYAPDEFPTLYTDTNGGDSDMIRPQDLRATNGTTIFAENLYYGIVEKPAGETAVYKVLGLASTLGTGRVSVNTSGFYYPRVDAYQDLVCCAFLCDSFLNNGEKSSDLSVDGVFIPIIPSRKLTSVFFERLALNNVSVAEGFTADYRNLTFGVICYPNAGLYGRGYLELLGGPHYGISYDTIVLSSLFVIGMSKVMQVNPAAQKPIGIRIETDRDNSRTLVAVYVCNIGTTAQNVADGTNLPSPASSTYVSITGDILDPDYQFEFFNSGILQFDLCTDSSFPAGTITSQTIVFY